MATENIQVVLASRPEGWVGEENFEVRQAVLPEPGDGELLVHNIYCSCDPYLRNLMSADSAYATRLEIGQPVRARAVGQVVASRRSGIAEGDLVWGYFGWQSHACMPAEERIWPVDPGLGPISHFISILGMPGLTAHVGMVRIAAPKPGETAFVSGAAGAVGQIAGQLAKLAGARVIGSAGSDAKCAYLTDAVGFDAAFNYKTEGGIGAALEAHCPDGIDVYYDNVGGATLDAVLARLNPHARIAVCGMISQYNRTERQGIHNLGGIVRNRVRIQGFIVGEHLDLLDGYQAEMAAHLKAGRIRYREDIVDGIDNLAAAFVGMLRGDNIGKRLVRVADDPTLG